MQKINRIFNAELKKCLDVVKEYVEKAKKDENFSENIREHDIIEQYMSCVKFFSDNDLLVDADQRLDSFRKYMSQAIVMIENAKKFGKLDAE